MYLVYCVWRRPSYEGVIVVFAIDSNTNQRS